MTHGCLLPVERLIPIPARPAASFDFPSLRTVTIRGCRWIQSIDFKGRPPATIIAAEIDPLRSEEMAYAEKLKAAGVPVTYQMYKGITHEFFGMGAVIDEAK